MYMISPLEACMKVVRNVTDHGQTWGCTAARAASAICVWTHTKMCQLMLRAAVLLQLSKLSSLLSLSF